MTKPLCKVHVQPPLDWQSQHWQVVRDDGGVFCSTWFAQTADGGDACERAELIARAVNEYIDRRQADEPRAVHDERFAAMYYDPPLPHQIGQLLRPCGVCGSFVSKFEDHKPGCGFGPMPPDKSKAGDS